MKVIMAGINKTGTKTMGAALTILGYEVYDWMENFWFIGDDWIKEINDGIKVESLRRMYKGVDAVTDCPCNAYWEEILEAFPDAKVILTVRDEDDWYKSLIKQFSELDMFRLRLVSFTTYTGYKMFKYTQHATRFLGNARHWPWQKNRLHNEEALKRMFRKHNFYVQQKTPKDQLLVVNTRELDWEVLCEFLGVPVPNVPFPHKNKGANIMQELRATKPALHRIDLEFKISMACFAGVCAFGAYRLSPYIPFQRIKAMFGF